MLSEISQMKKDKYWVPRRRQTQRQKVDGGGQGLVVEEIQSLIDRYTCSFAR